MTGLTDVTGRLMTHGMVCQSAAGLEELYKLGNHVRFYKNGVDQGPAYTDITPGPYDQHSPLSPCPVTVWHVCMICPSRLAI
jgi:hypothetical protein